MQGAHAVARAPQAAADVHQARAVGRRADLARRVARTLRSLSASIASETSAFLIAKVPPKPQHSCASGSSTRSMPRTARSRRSGLVPHPQRAQRVAGRVVGDAVRVRGPHVLDAELVHEELGKLEHAPGRSVVLAHGRGARRRRGHDRVVPGEDLGQPGGQPLGLAGSPVLRCICPQQVCSERELHFAAEPLEHPHGGDPRLREQRVDEAGDEEGDAHETRMLPAEGVSEGPMAVIRN